MHVEGRAGVLAGLEDVFILLCFFLNFYSGFKYVFWGLAVALVSILGEGFNAFRERKGSLSNVIFCA